jgi:ribosomal protein S18 acetylase RimI-like enzyme
VAQAFGARGPYVAFARADRAAQESCWGGLWDGPALVGCFAVRFARVARTVDAQLVLIARAASHRGCGLGRVLLDGAIDAATRGAPLVGARRLVLHVSSTDPVARGLFSDAGFVRSPEGDARYPDGSAALCCALTLDAGTAPPQ